MRVPGWLWIYDMRYAYSNLYIHLFQSNQLMKQIRQYILPIKRSPLNHAIPNCKKKSLKNNFKQRKIYLPTYSEFEHAF